MSAGHADFRVGGNQVLLGFLNIGPVLEEMRRKAGRYDGRQRLFRKRFSARDIGRILPEKVAEGIFREGDLPL